MNTLDAITSRRSIRSFMERSVPLSVVQDLLSIAGHSPSAGNSQPWQAVVVDDREILSDMAVLNPHGDMARYAPMGILVCGDLNREKIQGLWPLDCAAFTQSFLLAAHDRGLGTIWTAIYPFGGRVKSVRTLLDLPETIVPFSFVLLGYPARRPTDVVRATSVPVHYNRWADRQSFIDAASVVPADVERNTRN